VGVGLLLRRYLTGVLARHVIGQLVRAFVLALSTITAVFVLFVVVAKVADAGLGPRDVALLVPFAIPGTLPYTVPVSLLFAVSVVYGRIASDNEVIAVKASGQSALTVLWPAFGLGAALSVGLLVASGELIPRANHQAKLALLGHIEDVFYKVLKKDKVFDNARWKFYIRVRDVEGRVLHDAWFMHRAKQPEGGETFDLRVFAKRATIEFDQVNELVRVDLVESVIQGGRDQPDVVILDRDRLEFSMTDGPPGAGGPGGPDPAVQELTGRQIVERQALRRTQLGEERRRQAASAAMWTASGRLNRIDWPKIHASFADYDHWVQDGNKLETEKHMRIAVAAGAFFFALLGAPTGVLFARRDFLSAFITCFVPIITVYYPLTLAGVNLGKEGLMAPWMALLGGNLVLGVLSGCALYPVLRH